LPILTALTGRKGSIQRFRDFCCESVLKRLATGANRKDLFYHLVRQHVESEALASLKTIVEWRGAS
jgi:hypothetical protein